MYLVFLHHVILERRLGVKSVGADFTAVSLGHLVALDVVVTVGLDREAAVTLRAFIRFLPSMDSVKSQIYIHHIFGLETQMLHLNT